MPLRNVFFHVHVRKCGGSTFHNQILYRIFQSAFVRDSSLIDDRYGRDQVSEILSNCPWLQAYSSHKISLDLPYASDLARPIAIAFVRDPIQRFCSHYHYVNQHQRSWDPTAQSHNLDDYTRLAIDEGWLKTQRHLSQLSQLCGAKGQKGLERVRQYAHSEQVLLFPVERFDDACLVLERLFPRELGDCRYPHKINQSRPGPSLSQDCRIRLQQAIEPEEFELNRWANEQLDLLLNQLFTSPSQHKEAFDDFRQRCHASSQATRRSKPSRWLFWRNT
jgi:hypothetical protein